MTDIYIDVDTTIAIVVNKVPLIDDTDFKSRKVSITYNQSGMELVWNFTTSSGVVTQSAVVPTTAGIYDWTHVGDAVYKIEIPASGGGSINNDTEGYGYFSGICTGVLAWVSPIYTFRAAALNNALVDGGDTLDVNVTTVVDIAQTANDNGADINIILSRIPDVLNTTASGNIGIDLANVENPTTVLNLSGTTVKAITDAVTAGTVTDKTGYSLSAGGVQAIWDILTSALVQAGSIGKLLADNIDTTLSSRMSTTHINATAGAVDDVTLVATTTTNSDMRGTENALLTSAAPTNFGSMIISAGGSVDALVQGFLNTLITEITAGRIAGNFDTLFENADAVTTQTLDSVSSFDPTTDDVATVTNITNDVGITQAAADKVWATTSRALTDKAGFSINGVKQTLDDLVDLSTSDVDARLAAIGLDHLVAAAVTGVDVVDNSIIAKMVSKAITADWDTFNNTTEALEAIKDFGDANWTTGAGGAPPDLLLSTTIASMTSQTQFVLTDASPDNNAYNGQIVIVTDQVTGNQIAVAGGATYNGTTKEITLSADPAIFTMAVGDTIDIIAATGAAGTGATAAEVWAYASRTLTANTNLNDLSAAEIRTALGMAAADLDSQLATAQNDLDNLTGLDGAILATSQPNYAPNTVVPDVAGTAPTAIEIRQEIDTNSTKSGYALSATGLDLITQSATGVIEFAKAFWDRVLNKTNHNIAQSGGKLVRQLSATVVRQDTARGSGIGNNQIQLDILASAIDGAYDPAIVAIVDGTGAGQSRLVLQYSGLDKTATVDRNWKVNPDATSEFLIISDAGREHVNEGLAQAGTLRSITLNPLASDKDGAYEGQTVFIRSGTGDDQAGLVISYDGISKIAIILKPWAIIPDGTSAYVMLPTSLYDDTETTNIKYIIESQRGSYTATGDVYYWDPINGNDIHDGLSKETARLTFASIHNNLVIDNNHDVIIAIPGEETGTTITNEEIIISKNYTFLRGPGRDFRIIGDTDSDVITITGNGVEISGFVVDTHTVGTGIAVNVDGGDFARIHHIWSDYSRSHAIQLKDTSHSQVSYVSLLNAGQASGNGINIDGSGAIPTEYNNISDATIQGSNGDGISLTGANAKNNRIIGGDKGSNISHNEGYGVNDNGTVINTHVIGPNLAVHENVAGQINLTGTDAISLHIDEWATETKQDIINANIVAIKDGTIEKNVAGSTLILMTDANGDPVVGAAVTGLRKLDTGSFAAMTGVLSVTDAHGFCHVAYAAADVNGVDTVAFKLSAVGAKDSLLTLQLT